MLASSPVTAGGMALGFSHAWLFINQPRPHVEATIDPCYPPETKHLLTLQEGVSENQFREMCEENVKLVVPNKLHEHFPDSVKPHLITLESFIAEVRLLTV